MCEVELNSELSDLYSHITAVVIDGDYPRDCLSSQEIQLLKKCHIITAEDFITSSPLHIMAILKCSHAHYQKLIQHVSHSVAPDSITAMSLYSSHTANSLPTNISSIDSSLLGGLPPGTITEIAGPSGSGKTQMCYMLTVLASLPIECGGHLNKNVIYIDTDGAFSVHRLISMAESHLQSTCTTKELLETSIQRLASKMIVFKELTCNGLKKRLLSLNQSHTTADIGLLIIDSIAGLVRKEYDIRSTKGIVDRYHYLLDITNTLKCIAEEYQIPVIVTNQITTLSSSTTTNSDQSTTSVITSLGTSWSHCVNIRIYIEYWDSKKRKLSVVKCPSGPPVSVIVDIVKGGLVIDHTYTVQSEVITGDPNMYSLNVRTNMNIY